MDLSRRSDLPEVMDDPALPRADYERCLHNLAAVNRVTLTHRPTLRWLDRATRDLPADRPVSILDVACGEGDLLRAVHRWAARRGRAARLEGIDLNPRSALAAAAQTPPDAGIRWRTGDVGALAPDRAPRRHDLGRPRLPPRGVGAPPGRGRCLRRGRLEPGLPLV